MIFGYYYTTTDCKSFMVVFGETTGDCETFEIIVNNEG